MQNKMNSRVFSFPWLYPVIFSFSWQTLEKKLKVPQVKEMFKVVLRCKRLRHSASSLVVLITQLLRPLWYISLEGTRSVVKHGWGKTICCCRQTDITFEQHCSGAQAELLIFCTGHIS